ARPAVGQHALAEELDRFHDLRVRRAARMGVAQAQEEGAGAGGFLPSLEFPHARLRVAEDQAIRREILERERRVCRHVAELGQPVLPVVAIRGHAVGPYTVSASARVAATQASRICTTSAGRFALAAASL